MEHDGAKAMTLVELKRLVKCFAPPRPRLLFPFLDEPARASMTVQACICRRASVCLM
jgi:hypothetical protein